MSDWASSCLVFCFAHAFSAACPLQQHPYSGGCAVTHAYREVTRVLCQSSDKQHRQCHDLAVWFGFSDRSAVSDGVASVSSRNRESPMLCGSVWPETRDCAGNGLCLGAGVCVCDAGFSGVSDIVGAPVQDCHIQTQVVFALWFIILVLELFQLAVNLTLPDWKHLRNLRRGLAEFPIFRSVVFHLLVTISGIVLALYKIAHYPDPIPAIGHDAVATLFFFFQTGIMPFAILNTIWIWQYVVVHANTKLNYAELNSTLQPTKIFGAVGIVFAVINNALVFAIYDHPSQQEQIGAAFFITRGVRLFCFGLAEQRGLRNLISLLESMPAVKSNSDPSQPTVAMYRSLRRHSVTASIGFFTIAPMNVIIGAIPYLMSYGAYYIPVELLLVTSVKLSLIHAARFSHSQNPTPLTSRRISAGQTPNSTNSPGKKAQDVSDDKSGGSTARA